MKKYRIWEELLVEYTKSPQRCVLGEVEAESPEQAILMARHMFPQHVIERVDDQTTSYTIKDGVTFSSGLRT